MSNQLELLSQVTKVVADTGDFESIRAFQPVDATTNPSLVLKAAQKPEYSHIIDAAVKYAKEHEKEDKKKMMTILLDKLSVLFGKAILDVVPGFVSTEVDARLSFDAEKMIEKARTLIKMYEEEGISKDRILIKIASTWEGMEAARVLEAEGIHCNLTLMFSFCQAVAAAQVKATLISPFVGRIRDWYMKKEGRTEAYPVMEDPGVKSVRRIYGYYKKNGVKTVVMGASFRSVDEVLGLAGCDKLTIAPNLLQQLKDCTEPLPFEAMSAENCACEEAYMELDEPTFRWMLNEDSMATDLLSDGIRRFAADTEKLEKILMEKLWCVCFIRLVRFITWFGVRYVVNGEPSLGQQ